MKHPLLILLLIFVLHGIAQNPVLVVFPPYPTTADHVEIWYDAREGNGALAGFTGEVYAHTGLITTESQNGSDWKHIKGNWGQPDSTVLMTPTAEDIYYISFNIADFYGVDPGQEEVLLLAFVFRNADGSLVGRSIDNSDIYYSINHQPLTQYLDHTFENNRLCLFTPEGYVEVQPYTEGAVRLSFVPEGTSFPDTSYSTIMDPQPVAATLEDNSDSLVLHYSGKQVVIAKNPLRFSFYNNNECIATDEMGFYTQFGLQGVRHYISPGEKLYGGGSRAIPLNRRGYLLENYNQAHYGYGYGAASLNISIPVITSSENYMLYYDNQWPGLLSCGYYGNETDFKTEGGRMTYFFISGNSYDDLLGEYTALTGRQPLPPRWSLGYLQSQYGYENEDHARTVVNHMRAEGFPMDAMILDLYWFGNPTTMGNLTWDYKRFPDPDGMMDDFRNMGIKTILITEPFFTTACDHYTTLDNLGYLGKTPEGDSYVINDFWAGPAGLIDLTLPAANQWMWNFYSDRIGEGVEAWWSDLGEPEKHPGDMMHTAGPARMIHNVYSLLWAQMLYEKYADGYPEKRLFNLTRSGFAGMQRYATFPWSGDVQRSWEGLKAQIPIMLGMSLSGSGYMSSDLGGFVGGDNHELFTRWYQFGTFTPIMRPHGSNVTTEPVYFPEPYRSILKDYSELRYRLLPYNYTLAWQNSTTGRPQAMPLHYFNPRNILLQEIGDQYLWGEQMMVAPVMQEGHTSRNVIMPDGTWIDFHTHRKYWGGYSYDIAAPLERIPLFVRSGSFIPVAMPALTTDSYTSDTIGVWYYPDKSNSKTTFHLYLDDGTTRYADGDEQYEIITFEGSLQDDELVVTLLKSGPGYAGAPQTREMMFDIMRSGSVPEMITRNEVPVQVAGNIEEYYQLSEAAFLDTEQRILKYHYPMSGNVDIIRIEGAAVGQEEMAAEEPLPFMLLPPAPNPFSDKTLIRYDINKPGNHVLEITTLTGNRIMMKQLPALNKGRHSTILTGSSIAPGFYFVTLSNPDGYNSTQKLVKK